MEPVSTMSESVPDDLARPAHAPRAWPWREAIIDLLARTRLAQPDGLAAAVNVAVAALGIEVTVYLIDYEQRLLHPMPEKARTSVTRCRSAPPSPGEPSWPRNR
jgi:hypothetical protein